MGKRKRGNWAWKPKGNTNLKITKIGAEAPSVPRTSVPHSPIELSWAEEGRVIRLTDTYAGGVFKGYLVRYCEELRDGETAWGVSFVQWLELRLGWRLIGPNTFRRVKTIGEELKGRFDVP